MSTNKQVDDGSCRGRLQKDLPSGFVVSLRIRRGRRWLTTEEEGPGPLKEDDMQCVGMPQRSGYLEGPHVVRSSRRGKGSRLG